jgi:hypothetical protein
MKRLKGMQCMHQLTFSDDHDPQNTFFYKLCQVYITLSFKAELLFNLVKLVACIRLCFLIVAAEDTGEFQEHHPGFITAGTAYVCPTFFIFPGLKLDITTLLETVIILLARMAMSHIIQQESTSAMPRRRITQSAGRCSLRC